MPFFLTEAWSFIRKQEYKSLENFYESFERIVNQMQYMLLENQIISHKLTDSQKVDLIALHFPENKVIQYAASKNIVET